MTSKQREREIGAFEASTPRSKRLQEEAARYLPGGSSRGTAYFEPYPFFVDHAEGHYVYDVDGNRYLDFMINATTHIAGHANPDVVRAVKEQAERGVSYSTPAESQVHLAKLLCERVPSVETIRFTNSGTEGTLNAIRAARAFTGRHKIAKFEGGYHGAHEYVSVSVNPPAGKLDPAGPTAIPEFPGMPPKVLEDVVVLPYNDPENSERIIRAHKDELACLIMEPIGSNFGYVPGSIDFLKGMRELTRELGIILIYDEVQSFRVAPGGAQEAFDVIPDMTTFGKIIGGGLPVGAWGGRRDIMELFDPTVEGGAAIPHAGTLNANPMTMAAGLAVMKQLTPEVIQRMNAIGESARSKLRAVFDELGVPAQITGYGSLFGLHFGPEEVTDYRSMLRNDQALRARYFSGMLNEGVLMFTKPSGATCTLTTDKEIDDLVDASRRVIERVR